MVFKRLADVGAGTDFSPAIPVLAVVFAALCIWLTVRIINCRERWAMWSLAGAVAIVLLLLAVRYWFAFAAWNAGI